MPREVGRDARAGARKVLSHKKYSESRFAKVNSRQLILDDSNDQGLVDGFVRESTFAERLYQHFE